MNSTVKTIIFWVFIFACLILLWQVFQKGTGSGHDQEISFSAFLQDAQQGQLSEVTVNNSEVHGVLKAGNAAFHTTVPANYPRLFDILDQNKVKVTVRNNEGNSWLPILLNFSPILIIAALWFFMLRQMQSGGNKALSFGKSRARLLSMQQKKVTFKDVAGVDEAKEELKEIIEFFARRRSSRSWAAAFPRACSWSDLQAPARRFWRAQ